MVVRLTKNVKADRTCSACYSNLVHALHRLEKDEMPCREAIAIGQGFKGKTINGIGIEKCCYVADTQVKGCPPSAESIIKAIRG